MSLCECISERVRLAHVRGRHYMGLGRYNKAAQCLVLAIQLGCPSAPTTLGYLFSRGLGVPEDEQAAFDLFTQAASRGCRVGIFNLGICFEFGRGGVEKDNTIARDHFLLAHKLGHQNAAGALAFLYDNEGDREEAIKWWKLAAHQGHESAKTNVMSYYLDDPIKQGPYIFDYLKPSEWMVMEDVP